MVILVLIILSIFLAYKGMMVGVYPVLSRLLMGAVSIATGIGFAGPLRELIPSDNPYLYGACLATIAVVAYIVQGVVCSFYIADRQITLPEFVDRIGGAASGLAVGAMLGGFACMVAMTLPLPQSMESLTPQLRKGAGFTLFTTRFVAVFAGTDKPIVWKNILPEEQHPPAPEKEVTSPADDPPKHSPPAESPSQDRTGCQR